MHKVRRVKFFTYDDGPTGLGGRFDKEQQEAVEKKIEEFLDGAEEVFLTQSSTPLGPNAVRTIFTAVRMDYA